MDAAGRRAGGIPAPLLLVASVLSVQFGAGLAITIMPRIGPAGAVLMRLGFGAILMVTVLRANPRRYTRRALGIALAFGIVLGTMNFTFYQALSRVPMGIAVTVEFLGPLLLAAVLSRSRRDFLAIGLAGVGVALASRAFEVPLASLDWVGLALALGAGALWAAYIVLSERTGGAFERLDGLTFAMVIAGLVVLPMGIGSVPQWDTLLVVKGVGIALLSSVLPYSLELVALRSLSPAVFGVLMSLEPAAGALAGLLVLGQHLSVGEAVGVGFVTLASVLIMGRSTPDTPLPEPVAQG